MTNSLTNQRWAPGLLDDFRKEMSRFAEGFFEDATSNNFFAPSVNFAETEKNYEVTVELPGMKPEDVHVEFKDSHLWITGERKHELEQKGKTYHRVERRYGSFRRVIALGSEVDADKVQASYQDGILTVDIPKVAAAQPRRIEVKC